MVLSGKPAQHPRRAVLPPLKASPGVGELGGHRKERGWSIYFTVLLHDIPAFLQGSVRKFLGKICTILMPMLLKVLPLCLQLQKKVCALVNMNLTVHATQKRSDHDFKPSILRRWHQKPVQSCWKTQRCSQGCTQIQTLYRHRDTYGTCERVLIFP